MYSDRPKITTRMHFCTKVRQTRRNSVRMSSSLSSSTSTSKTRLRSRTGKFVFRIDPDALDLAHASGPASEGRHQRVLKRFPTQWRVQLSSPDIGVFTNRDQEPKGPVKNNLAEGRSDLRQIWSRRLRETAGVASYIEDFPIEERPKMA